MSSYIKYYQKLNIKILWSITACVLPLALCRAVDIATCRCCYTIFLNWLDFFIRFGSFLQCFWYYKSCYQKQLTNSVVRCRKEVASLSSITLNGTTIASLPLQVFLVSDPGLSKKQKQMLAQPLLLCIAGLA